MKILSPKIPFLFILVLTASQAVSTREAISTPKLRDGDIIFQTSRSAQSLAIQKATHSKYSHMGIIFLRAGKPYVYEAIRTVQYTALEQWAARGVGGRYVVKRLREAEKILASDGVSKLRKAAAAFQGKPYDFTFEWSDDRIYCSELVWKIYERALGMHLGDLQRLREFDLSAPAVKTRLKERYGTAVPLNEKAISPAGIFSCNDLILIVEH